MRLPLWTALAICVAILSGCLGPESDEPSGDQSVAVSLPGQCSLEPEWPPCSHSSANQYVIEGLSLVREAAATITGITIEFLDRDIVLRNVSVTGFDNGIVVRSARCTSCTLRFENVIIEGSGVAASDRSPWQEHTGIVGMESPNNLLPRVDVQGLTIQGFATGIVWLTGESSEQSSLRVKDASVACKHEGVRVAARQVHIENLTMMDCKGVGVYAGGFDHFTLGRAQVVRNWQGVALWGTREGSAAQVGDSLVEENEVGGILSGAGSLRIEETAFHGNGAAPNPEAYSGLEADVLHAVLVGGGNTVLRGNCIQGNVGWGAATTVGGSVDAAENWWGSPTGPRMGTVVQGDFQHPMPLVPVGEGDLVPAGTIAAPFLSDPASSCSLEGLIDASEAARDVSRGAPNQTDP